jgi:hypothetical protein
MKKSEFDYLDQVGTHQISIHDMNWHDREYLVKLIKKAVNIIPFAEVEGMNELIP